MLPNLLIWDWNGTILDDTDLCLAIENELLRERGMKEITKEWYLDHFAFPIEPYYRQMGYTFETETYDAVAAQFMERYNNRYRSCPVRSGVKTVLTQASACGIRQTLLSVTEQTALKAQVTRLGLDGYFGELLGLSDQLGQSKVERAKAYMKRIGIDPKDALFIGDTDHDVEAARAVGCPCVLLTGGHQSKAVLLRCGVPVYDSVEAMWESLLL